MSMRWSDRRLSPRRRERLRPRFADRSDTAVGRARLRPRLQTFATSIEPILSAHGCDNLNCHGGGIRGTFELSPNGNKNVQFDFDQACMQVNGRDPVASPLIMKPLAPECGGPRHAGGFVFSELNDPNYLAILTWIEAGEYR